MQISEIKPSTTAMPSRAIANRTLAGKRIILLGGTSGFGFATAERAALEGAQVVIASSRMERVKRALERLPDSAEGHTVELTKEEEVKAFFDRVGPFDHLVFTAGETLQVGDLAETRLEQAKQFFNIRFWGAFMAAKYGSRAIRAGGSIVLTNGLSGLRPQKGWSVVSSICGALEALTRELAIELAPIRVNLVCAGFVRTELWHNLPENEMEEMFAKAGQQLPVGRVGEADDLAETYLYLMRQGFSTGAMIVVDGGGAIA
jgi:NAD(P)-dependent dehydrogenase (short-subunit alcohol dehydrogenase family)